MQQNLDAYKSVLVHHRRAIKDVYDRRSGLKGPAVDSEKLHQLQQMVGDVFAYASDQTKPHGLDADGDDK